MSFGKYFTYKKDYMPREKKKKKKEKKTIAVAQVKLIGTML